MCWSVGKGEGCEKMWGKCGKVCWGMGRRCGKVGGVVKYGISVGKCFGCGGSEEVWESLLECGEGKGKCGER